MFPLAMSGMSMGIKNGLIRPGPPAIRFLNCVSYVAIPPMPDPKTTPYRSGSSPFREIPASAIAWSHAITANWANGSMRCAPFLSRKSVAL